MANKKSKKQQKNKKQEHLKEIDRKAELDAKAAIETEANEDKNQLVEQLMQTEEKELQRKDYESKNSSVKIPQTLNTSMSEQDFCLLKEYAEKDDIKGFIESYQSQHKELSHDDIVSLALTHFMELEDSSFRIFGGLYSEDLLSLNHFVTLDHNGKNALLYSLEHVQYSTQSACYVSACANKNDINKNFVLGSDTMKKFADAIKCFRGDTHPWNLIDELVRPIYTEESTKELIEAIGQDWLDSYYI